VKKLNREWEHLAGQAPDWPADQATLGEVLAGIAADPDAALIGLLTACQAGHCLAGRTVLQAFLGKLVLLARAHPQLDLTDLVSAFWLRLATYPVERRPHSVAANLSLDVLSDALKATRPLGHLMQDQPDEVTAAAVLQAARALGLASPATLEVVAAMYSPDGGSRRVAEQFQISREAVRRRCCDTVARLRRERVRLTEYLTGD